MYQLLIWNQLHECILQHDFEKYQQLNFDIEDHSFQNHDELHCTSIRMKHRGDSMFADVSYRQER